MTYFKHLHTYCLLIGFLCIIQQGHAQGPVLSSDPGHGKYCPGEEGVLLEVDDLQDSFSYYLQKKNSAGNWENVTDTDIPEDPDTPYTWPDYYSEGTFRAVEVNSNDNHLFSNEVTVQQATYPQIKRLTNLNDSPCSPVEPGFEASQQGVTYYLYLDDIEMTQEEGNGGQLSFGEQTEPGTYTAIAELTDEPHCSIDMLEEVTAYPVPNELTISPAEPFCAGEIHLTFHETEPETIYYIINDQTDDVFHSFEGDGSDKEIIVTYSPGDYRIKAIHQYNGTSCQHTFSRLIQVGEVAEKFSMLNDEGCPGTEIGLENCEEGVTYQLPPPAPYPGNKYQQDAPSDTSKQIETATCSDNSLSFGSKNIPGIYQIEAEHDNSGCITQMHGNTTIHPQPNLFSLTPDVSDACIDVTTIGLESSESAVIYRLYHDNILISEVSGHEDGSPIAFDDVEYEPGTYKIEAFYTEGYGCSRWMEGQITLHPEPEVMAVTANGDTLSPGIFCSDVSIGLSASEAGVSYQIQLPDGEYGPTVPGDQGGGPIDLGTFSGPGTYFVKAYRGGCNVDMEGTVTILELEKYMLHASETAFCEDCDESIELTLEGSQQGVIYTLLKDGVDIGIDPIAGDGSAIIWSNISQYGPGSYHVQGELPEDDSCLLTTNEITIHETPYPSANFIAGQGSEIGICNNECVTLTLVYEGAAPLEVIYSNGHEQFTLQLNPANGTEHDMEVCPSQDVVYEVETVRYLTPPYCEVNIANPEQISISIFDNPEVFTLTGNAVNPHGEQCSPVVPILSDSEVDVEYTLLREMDQEIETLTGDGSILVFDTLFQSGTYFVTAQNDYCEKTMQGEAIVNALPEPRNLTPSGNICSHTNFSAGLDGSAQEGIIYTLLLDGDGYSDAEVIDGDVADEVSFNNLNQPGTYRIHAENKNTGCQKMMNGSLTAQPAPQAFMLNPEEPVCNPAVIYLNQSDTGVDYALWRTGDDEEAEQIITGTGSPIYFDKVYKSGDYIVIATNEGGCSRSMTGEVNVLSLPEQYDITPSGGNYCIDDNLEIGLTDSETGKRYELYRSDLSEPVQEIQGTGDPIAFNAVTEVGTYQIKAVNESTLCEAWMEGEVKINKLPYSYILKTDINTPDLCPPLELGLDTTQIGVEYILELPDGEEIQKTGTGEAISFGKVYIPGTYTSYAYHPETTCTIDMNGEIILVQGPASFELFLEDNNPYFCPEDHTGNHLFLEESEMDLIYQLYKNGEPVEGTGQGGHGGMLQWEDVGQFGEGYYQVMAISADDPDCMIPMEHEYFIEELETPLVGFSGNESVVFEICDYPPYEVELEFSGNLPMDVDYTVNNEPFATTIDPAIHSSPFTLTLPAISSNTEIEITNVSYAEQPFCEGDIGISQAEVLLSPFPVNQLDEHKDICGIINYTLFPEAAFYETFEWSLEEGHGELVDVLTINPTYIPTPEDIGNDVLISLVLTGVDECDSHYDTTHVYLHYFEGATVNAGSDKIILAGDSIRISDASAFNYESIYWEIQHSDYYGELHDEHDISPIYYSDQNDAGKTIPITLEARGVDNCEDILFNDTKEILVGTPIEANFEAIEERPDTTLCAGLPVYFRTDIQYEGFTPHPDQVISKLEWNFGDGHQEIVHYPEDNIIWHVFEEHGMADVTLIAETGIHGDVIHTDTIQKNVHILDCSSNNLVFPNALAPEHPDPEVSGFLPKGINIVEYKLEIYDMKGNLVWETTELDPYDGSPTEPWYGNYSDGREAPQGVYIWQVFARFRDGGIYGKTVSEGNNKGTVTLIR